MDIIFGSPQENREKVEKLLKEAADQGADIAVLPELWTTGYDLVNLDKTADAEATESTIFLSEMAKKLNIHIVGGSVANKTKKGVENTMLVVRKDGHHALSYSKTHLFRLMDEHQYLTPGHLKGTFHMDGHNFAGVICYDIRFPEWIRAQMLTGTEALFVVAEWPKARLDHWRTLLIARAIENQCYVIACNRAGSDPRNVFAGHSMIINPWGAVLTEAGEGEEIIHASINLDKVKEIRKHIPVFSDRRPELYD
nr:carbon-nitrogen family hydrolase [Bacillus mediterraneensis]